MAKIHVGAEEKVGLPNYSNVTITAFYERDIPDDADIKEELVKVAIVVEGFVAEERERVLAGLKGE